MGYFNDYLFQDNITWITDGIAAGTVRFSAGKFYCTNVCGVLISNQGYNNKIMAEIINSVAYKYVIKTDNRKLMNNVMEIIPIAYPPTIKEQERLSHLIDDIDNLIKVQERYIANLKLQKQSLLQQMFV